jgi:co-chaperonin GroES (HSP10)
MNSITPMEGWVVVLPIIEEEVKTQTGIILQEKTDKEKQNLGLVVAVPSKTPITKGCKIFYKPYAHIDCQVNEEKYYLIEFQDICGVLNKENGIEFTEQGV